MWLAMNASTLLTPRRIIDIEKFSFHILLFLLVLLNTKRRVEMLKIRAEWKYWDSQSLNHNPGASSPDSSHEVLRPQLVQLGGVWILPFGHRVEGSSAMDTSNSRELAR